MKFVIVTGMSGAGKSHALKFLEDIGFFCSDNIPPTLILKFAELIFNGTVDVDNAALGVDIRGGKLFIDMEAVFVDLKKNGYEYEILFLDAFDDVLIKRFKETRRTHPFSKIEPVLDSIKRERQILKKIRSKADYIVDTSDMLTRQLKERINELYVLNKHFPNLSITVVSFGYKYGLPPECDLVMDVRFIPNPFYFKELKYKTGNDQEVYDYVMSQNETREFINRFMDLLDYLIPNYINEGKNSLVVGIGCTGGKHRSVTIAKAINDELNYSGNFSIVKHRDIGRDTKDY